LVPNFREELMWKRGEKDALECLLSFFGSFSLKLKRERGVVHKSIQQSFQGSLF
jgi:hypothetical protein